MNDEEKIKTLAEPILKKLEELETKHKDATLVEIPKIKFIKEQSSEPMMIGDIEVTDELLEKLEKYLQEEIEMMHMPTILH